MAEERNICVAFTNRRSIGGGDIESGSNDVHASNTERIDSVTEAPIGRMTNEGNGDGHLADTDIWAASLASLLDDVPSYMCTAGLPGRISRIPDNLREIDVNAYEPYLISIGPYHHGKPRVQPMEKRKQMVLKFLLENKPELLLKDYLIEIQSIEPAVRRFYSDVDMDSEKFVRMLLLDSLYILAVFCGVTESNEDETHNIQMITSFDGSNDEMGSEENNTSESRWFWTLFTHDIFLLENQLPFFLLERIHALTYSRSENSLINIVKTTVGYMISNYTKLDPEMMTSTEEVHHLLHLCHMYFRPSVRQVSTCNLHESSQMFRLGSAVQLYEAGVSFKPRSESTKYSLLDITFGCSGRMTVPCLHIDDNINSLLRNLIALEQMKYPYMGLNICAYVVFMLHLVTIPEDVELLRKKGILDHHLASDKEMVYFVNRLSIGLSFDYVEDEYSLKPVFQELKRYTEQRRPRWRAWLKQRYFNNPWTTISLLAASFLILLSALQTFYTVFSYYHPYFNDQL